MSSKSTILLSQSNEHWYVEYNGPYNENITTERCIVLEIDAEHIIETDDEGTRIIIESDTELYRSIMGIFK